ncbi:MAG: hypothetical protein US43_C0001G0002 [Candidatus Levybacteria bacterium GW2011_GWA1_37_16]|nr:MAG: hypothetical protein US43_C0001G0002 [Candidatus Levybacteria bacterium GW2011_GWA1_37_16]
MDNQNQQVPPVPSQEEAKASNNLSFLKIIAYGFAIVSVGVSIAIGGYLLGTSKSKSQPAAQISVTPSPTPDPTANWQIYNNQNIFTFKYPSDWDVAQLSSLALPTLIVAPKTNIDALRKVNFQVGGGKQSVISITGSSTSGPIPFVYTSDSTKSVAKRLVVISGFNATEYTSTYIADLPGISLGDVIINNVVDVGSRAYSIGLNDISYKDMYDQIISTFKFSGQSAQVSITPNPTANWKTYTVTKLGIEFKYPPNFSPIAIFDNELFPISFTDNSNTKHRLSTSPDISIKVIPIVSGDDYKTTLIKDVIFAGSGMHPKSFVEFSSKTIGGNMVYYIKTGLFEGVLSINYYLVNKNQVFAFNLTSSPVDWTNPNFKPEEDLLNLNMQQILSTFKFTN